jgi:hypothetical protein
LGWLDKFLKNLFIFLRFFLLIKLIFFGSKVVEKMQYYLFLKEIKIDSDKDTLLIKATPQGPTCHTGTDTCWDEKNESNNFL